MRQCLDGAEDRPRRTPTTDYEGRRVELVPQSVRSGCAIGCPPFCTRFGAWPTSPVAGRVRLSTGTVAADEPTVVLCRELNYRRSVKTCRHAPITSPALRSASVSSPALLPRSVSGNEEESSGYKGGNKRVRFPPPALKQISYDDSRLALVTMEPSLVSDEPSASPTAGRSRKQPLAAGT
jgi:hypothetical protein